LMKTRSSNTCDGNSARIQVKRSLNGVDVGCHGLARGGPHLSNGPVGFILKIMQFAVNPDRRRWRKRGWQKTGVRFRSWNFLPPTGSRVKGQILDHIEIKGYYN
jgi:hypothetical protein